MIVPLDIQVSRVEESGMTKLFVSHASEDKEAFARPLALALRKHFDVWFDEFELKVGDSLRNKIDAGLRDCDYGVVVLSPAFFSKKWPVAELNGLFAQEDVNRKIILPVWFQVSEADVRGFSPILADRLAVDASRGLDRVVEELRLAVGASERTHEVLVPDVGRVALEELVQKLQSRELDKRVLESESGAELYERSVCRIGELIWDRLDAVNRPERKRFALREKRRYLQVQGPFKIWLSLTSGQPFGNSVAESRLVACFLLRDVPFTGGRGEEKILEEMSFTPTCLSEEKIGYRFGNEGKVLTEDEVAPLIVQQFCERVAERMRTCGGN
ncbi:MAG: toll/interleukin-1 receptor domain-containing protein [Limisphaerales bacterium]